MSNETMTDARALEILGDLCAGQWENVAEPALQHLASRLRGEAARGVEQAQKPAAKLVNKIDTDGGRTTTFIRPTGLGIDLPLGEYPLYLEPLPVVAAAPAAPAPVAGDAVAALPEKWREIEKGVRDRPSVSMPHDVGRANELIKCADELEAALAQDRASQAGAAVDTSTNESWIARAESKLATQPPAVGVDVDYTVEEVDAVIDAATERGTRHVPVECIEQMRTVLHAALRTGGGA